jgi:hypothetical protein
MNTTIERLREKINWYCERFQLELQESNIYALYPSANEYGWPTEYPNSNSAGIYAMLDCDKNIIYIGKSNNLGYRLSSYFAYDENRGCRLKDSRVEGVKYLITFATKDSEKYACSSLEEYLISELTPKCNTIGVY